MNSVTRTSVFSRSFSSRRFCSSTSRKLAPPRAGALLPGRRPFDRRQGARDVLGDRFLIHQRLLALLALLPLLAPPLLQRNRARRADATGRGGAGTAPPGVALATGLGRTGVGIMGRAEAGGEGGRGEGRGGMGRGGSGGRRLRPGLLGHRELLEQRRGALLERRLLLLVHGFGRLEHLAALSSRFRLDRRFGLGLRSTAAISAAVRRRRLAAVGSAALLPARPPLGAAALGAAGASFCFRFLTLPARPHQRHLLGLERREVAAHEDVPAP